MEVSSRISTTRGETQDSSELEVIFKINLYRNIYY
jgi:hypothetical protein